MTIEPDPDATRIKKVANIAQVTLGEDLLPLMYAQAGSGFDYDYAGENDEEIYYRVNYELDDGGSMEEILAVSKLDGTTTTITIQTDGDGVQTITMSNETLEGMTYNTHTITIDADGNAVTDLETIDDLSEFLDRTVTLSVEADLSYTQSKLFRLKNTLDSIKNKTITITTNTKSPSGGGLEGLKDLLNLPKAANGASNFKGGYALINEEGPELVAGNGLA